jgi:ABC-2 type transport system permease protein
MRNTITIAQRELTAYFTSPMAYIITVFFLFFTGLIFTFSIYQQGARAELRGLLGSMVFLTLMIAPFLTMSLLAQERASGTLEMLLTKPVRDVEVVLGKYLAALGFYVLMIVLTFTYPLLMSKYGDFDWGPAWVGYLGLILAGAAFLAIGIFASSLTRSQMASAGICLGVFLFIWLIGWVSYLVGGEGSLLSDVAKNISVFEVFGDFEKGMLDSKNIVYFLSLAVVSLFLAVRVLEMRRQV